MYLRTVYNHFMFIFYWYNLLFGYNIRYWYNLLCDYYFIIFYILYCYIYYIYIPYIEILLLT